eukprot:TRINITY_DN8419_c0_g1_i1.p1 TRINITY_DN8419_c0_g1~~TRINITY_DN8419_c0_g1_i1.p1  ORF type:complete len:694 (+),score=130.68 TRINITY_DN8419_c0_g1_i1:92-2083(+)
MRQPKGAGCTALLLCCFMGPALACEASEQGLPDGAWCAELLRQRSDLGDCWVENQQWRCPTVTTCVQFGRQTDTQCDSSVYFCSGHANTTGTMEDQVEQVLLAVRWAANNSAHVCHPRCPGNCPTAEPTGQPSLSPSAAPTAPTLSPSRHPSTPPSLPPIYAQISDLKIGDRVAWSEQGSWGGPSVQLGTVVRLAAGDVFLQLLDGKLTQGLPFSQLGTICMENVKWEECGCNAKQRRNVTVLDKLNTTLMRIPQDQDRCKDEEPIPVNEYRTCTVTQQCDCKVHDTWSNWSNCSNIGEPCGTVGVRKRTRAITQARTFGGAFCPPTVDFMACQAVECQETLFDNWWDWAALILGCLAALCCIAFALYRYLNGGQQRATFAQRGGPDEPLLQTGQKSQPDCLVMHKFAGDKIGLEVADKCEPGGGVRVMYVDPFGIAHRSGGENLAGALLTRVNGMPIEAIERRMQDKLAAEGKLPNVPRAIAAFIDPEQRVVMHFDFDHSIAAQVVGPGTGEGGDAGAPAAAVVTATLSQPDATGATGDFAEAQSAATAKHLASPLSLPAGASPLTPSSTRPRSPTVRQRPLDLGLICQAVALPHLAEKLPRAGVTAADCTSGTLQALGVSALDAAILLAALGDARRLQEAAPRRRAPAPAAGPARSAILGR